MKPDTAARRQYKDRLVNHFSSRGDRSRAADQRASDGARAMVALVSVVGPLSAEGAAEAIRAAHKKHEARLYNVEILLRDLQAAKMIARGPDGLYRRV